MIRNKKAVISLTLISLLLFSSHSFAEKTLREKSQEALFQKQQQKSGYFGKMDLDFTFAYEGRIRKFKVHLPNNYNKDILYPAVIYLHGGGGSIKAAYQDGVDKASDKFGFILVIPAGTGILPNRLLTWNAGTWAGGDCCGPAFKNNIDDVGFISKIIDEIKKEFNIDKNRIYATGISNGAMMSYRLACELSDKIAAVAVVASPAVPEGCAPPRPISIMQINGTVDPAVPINGGKGGGIIGKTFQVQVAQEMVNSWVQRNECAANYTTTYQKGNTTCITYSPCKNGVEVVFCKVKGMGHTWPSGHQYMPVAKVGPVSYDISFDQIWEFFQKQCIE